MAFFCVQVLLLPAPHHLIILLVVHFVKAGMMTASVAVEGGASFERMHHETEARARAHVIDWVCTRSSWRDVGHLQAEGQFSDCYWISDGRKEKRYLGPDAGGLGLTGRAAGFHDGRE